MTEAELSRIVKREYDRRYEAKHPEKAAERKRKYDKSERGRERHRIANQRYRESCKMA